MVKENSRGLSDAATNAKRQQEEYKGVLQEQFEELTLLQTQGSEVFLAIVGPPRVEITCWRGCNCCGRPNFSKKEN
jgi:hypothetical protein